MKNIVFCIMLAGLSFLSPVGSGFLVDAKASDNSGLDGVWSLKERLCINKKCTTSTSDITITTGKVYVEGTEVGSVTQEGKSVTFEYNSDYMTSKFQELFTNAGYDVTVESYEMKKYKGKVKNNNLMTGKIKGTVTAYFNNYKTTYTLDFSGTFKGKKQ